MKIHRLLSLFIVLLFVGVLRTSAQDVKPTAEATPVVTIPAEEIPASSDPMIQLSLWQLLAGLAAAFSLGGITIGTGAGVVAYRLRTNPATMKAIEGLATSTPQETVDKITTIVDKFQFSLTEVFALLREAYDKKPYGDKTPEERAAVLYPAQAATGTGTGYTITGNQEGVTITADTSPATGYASSSTMSGVNIDTSPRMPDNG